MSYRPGDNFYKPILTFNISGISTDADITPWATMVHNGLDDFSASAKVFVTHIDLGRYTASGIIPSTYLAYDSVQIIVSGIVATYLAKGTIELETLDALAPNVNVVSFSGFPVAAPGVSGSIIADIRYALGSNIVVTGVINATLASGGWDNIMIEPNVNARQALSEISASTAGVSSGVGNWIWYDGINNPTTWRIAANAISGIRTIVNYNLPL